ncbi:unnamed protein product [Callosobruchus maculatus]|uniref:Uncharacterized protein n=2 Tax=Callosobruchus maculatus TaxID=64391 RepID=A0A653CHB6_CALMS|nr:unnamed protein product [Callosobruchus maculatus]
MSCVGRKDEAAGMVEGILDFGRAGLRKGLRLTGLQDSAAPAAGRQPTVGHGQPVPGQGCKRHPPVAAAVTLTTRPESNEITTRTGSGDSVDNVWMNPLQMDSPNFDGQILLEKPAAKAEEAKEPEAMEFEGGRKEISRQIPSISTEEADCGLRSDQNSPEPEYEDTADLASSIAKLRSLLQQRSSESSLSTPALSPMPPDVADEQQVSAAAAGASFQQRPLPFEETDLIDEGGGETEAYGGAGGGVGGVGVMPTFYKFCAKTATGVLDKTLHTIKTALPAGHPHPFQQTGPDNAWIFILPDSDEADIFTRMKKLLTERKEFCTLDDEIDTAYEAIDSLDTFQLPYSPSVTFEDELEPFEVRVPVARALVEVACELLADTGCPFVQEPIVKTFLLTMGPTLEHLLVRQADALMETVCVRLMRVPDRTDRSTLRMEMSAYLDALVHSLPDCVKMTLGVSPVSQAMSVLMSSIQREAVNQDLALQLLELLALKLIEECGATQHSPPTSA